ncbi:hypothetical protein OSB04_010960 [Centaurea solstitialis]|uniref:TIR domain-containing protein n=1 Tax=Centaurea solstitialis TaxID=347529 RepID=A0AA38TJ94_9ASTR|nr:hypothetical protein OSB04_010960 [Centaurea solstitialis]
MASSSTSSIPKTSFKYDVFLSFRGEDTRTNFVDHLYHALQRQNIETYKDDKNLEKGKKISKELIEAIEESRFHVIIFSKNYASSSWCLDELVKIIECQETQTGHTVYPIFYHVEPTQVRKQSGEFGKAFSKHENDEAAEKWRKALADATSFSGRDLCATADGHEVEFIELVVEDISLKLPTVNADGNLIGMRNRISGMVSSLNTFPNEACMIGIWGMGGSGKTTLARAVFDQIRTEFEGSSFVENVRERSDSLLLGLQSLQQQVLRDVSKRQNIFVNGVLEGKTEMKKKMHGIKVLVVLDDVDHLDQLKALAGELNWFKSGSRIIITTRDKQVLVAHKVNLIHDVSLLTDEEAVCLLSRCAFGREIPIPEYKGLSKEVVKYAAGLPLTITILGSSLCEAKEHEWLDTIKRLKKIPLKETLQKLELSYMGLDDDCKEMFLDVACIMKGWIIKEAIKALESCGFHAIHGLNVLQKRSLITISEHGYLYMHDHIQEMGRYIVRHSNLDEPGRHTRLWIREEIEDILANDLVTEATCIKLSALEVNQETIIKGLKKMEKLRFLLVKGSRFSIDWEFYEDIQYFPNSLQYLRWDNYKLSVLPKQFQASNLVALEMSCCSLKQLWEAGERKVLHKLRFLDLSWSLLRTFDLGLTPNIEILNLDHCRDLVEFHMPLQCPKLKSLNLNFSKLSTLDLSLVPNIEALNLIECVDLVKLDIPSECPQLKLLEASSLKLRSLDLRLVPNIATLNLEECKDLVELEMPRECPQLKYLVLSSPAFRTLSLWCGPTSNIETFKQEECDYLVEFDMVLECPQLKSLILSVPTLRTLDIRSIQNLKRLSLQECYYLVELCMPDGCIMLESIYIKRCLELKTLDLRQSPNLERLHLEECSSLLKLHVPVGGLKKLIDLEAKGFLRFTDLNIQKSYGLFFELTLHGNLVDICPLHPDNNFPKYEFECSYKEDLPSSNGNIEKLISIGLSCACIDFESFSESICDLKHLGGLKLKGSIPEVPKDLDRLQCLERLTLLSTSIKYLPDSILLLKHLKRLTLNYCVLLEKLPEDLGRLDCLEELYFNSLKIKHLPDSICMLKHLKSLKLEYCELLVKLPEDLGRLECLERLYLNSLKIKRLPDSICMLKHLKSLTLEYCELLEKLPEDFGRIECLQELILSSIKIKHLPDSICMLKHLKSLTLISCLLLEKLPEDLGRLECLERLCFNSLKIKHLPDNICFLKQLKSLELFYCELLEKLPQDLGRLECLQTLKLQGCIVLRDIPNSICRLKSLKRFSLFNCNRVEELPNELGRLECLKELDIRGSCINNLPQSILILQGLQIRRDEEETHTTASTGIAANTHTTASTGTTTNTGTTANTGTNASTGITAKVVLHPNNVIFPEDNVANRECRVLNPSPESRTYLVEQLPNKFSVLAPYIEDSNPNDLLQFQMRLP